MRTERPFFKLAALVLAAALLVPLAAPAEQPASGGAGTVLRLVAYDSANRPLRAGYGFTYGRNYLLVSTYHLVENARWVLATSGAGDQYIVPYVSGADKAGDIVILMFYS